MNRLRKICLAIAAPLFCVSGIFAQEKNPADTTAVTTPAAPQDAASDDTEETLPPFDEKAPIMKGKPKRYFIRKINLRGIEYLNKTVVQASTGLVPGDSIYLPSENIADVIAKLWNQRLFADVKVGATIDGDSVDMEISVRERPRVYRWLFEGEGVGKGRQKDIIEKLQLKTGGELSDYVIDKNTKLIKKYFAEKAFPQCGGERAHRERSVIQNAVNVTFVIDRKRKVKIGKTKFHGKEQGKENPPPPPPSRSAPEEHQLLQVVETQGGRLRNGQGEPHRLLQLERLPQLHDPERLDLPDQRPPTGYRPLGVGGQQVLHPQHHMGRQLGLPDQRPATHVRRQIGRHLRQEVDQQAAGHTARRTTPRTCRSSRSTRTTAT